MAEIVELTETRVVLDYGGGLYGLTGMVSIAELPPTISRHGRTFERIEAKTDPPYMLYRLKPQEEAPPCSS